MARSADDSGPRFAGQAVARPLFECCGESFLHCILCDLEISKQTDHSGEDPPKFLSIKTI